MDIKEIAKKIAELHYPNHPLQKGDAPYRMARIKALSDTIETEFNNVALGDVSRSNCGHEWEITTGICVKCGKSKYYG